MMQIKILIAAAITLVVVYFSYQAGADSVRADVAEQVALARADEAKKVKEVIKWKEKTKVVYRDRIKKIKVAEDPTGCLDANLRDVGLGSLLSSTN